MHRPAQPVPHSSDRNQPGLPAHPHQLGVQEFDAYDRIVDLRSPAEYQIDHLPGAINVPWRWGGGAIFITDGDDSNAATQDVQFAEEATPGQTYTLLVRMGGLAPGASVLVYGEPGPDGFEAAACLKKHGFRADELPGGWDNYRRWVKASLEVLSRALTFRWVRAAPSGVAQAVLAALAAEGHQVLPLASILAEPGIPGLVLPGRPVHSQQALDTLLLDALRRLDPERPVWVDEVVVLGDAFRLPPVLSDALAGSSSVWLEAAISARAVALCAYLEAQGSGLDTLIRSVLVAVPSVHHPALKAARRMVAQGKAVAAAKVVLSACVDALFDGLAGAQRADQRPRIALTSWGPNAARECMAKLPIE